MKKQDNFNKDIKLKDIKDFRETGINQFLIECLIENKFVCPTPIQYYSIKTFNQYQNSNIIGQSKSGTGKTLAFLIPVLNYLCVNNKNIEKQTVCLIILPTRELSIQVYQYLKQILVKANEIKAKNNNQKQYKRVLRNLSSLLTIGGIPIQDDKKTLLIYGANIVIGTLGKIHQLIQIGSLKLNYLKFVVFDQGDKLFQNKDQKLQKILNRIKCYIRTIKDTEKSYFRFLIYSATYTEVSIKKIMYKLKQGLNFQLKFIFIQTLNLPNKQFLQIVTQKLTELKFINFQKHINNDINNNLINLDNIKKFWIDINQNEQKKGILINKSESLINKKCKKLKQILKQTDYKRCLIFVEKKALLEQIYDQIIELNPLLIHGSLSQSARIKVMNQANNSKIIIASDLIARGIDLILDLVILYDSNVNETFWHRIGRTGRFGRVGIAISLVKIQNWNQCLNFIQINNILNQTQITIQQNLKKKKQWYGTFMTQYGQWSIVDPQKEQIINQQYEFFQQHSHKKEINNTNLIQLSKKQQKIIKKNRKIQEQYKNYCEIERVFESQKDFINKYSYIFRCKKCNQSVKNVQKLTQYKFQLQKYFQK